LLGLLILVKTSKGFITQVLACGGLYYIYTLSFRWDRPYCKSFFFWHSSTYQSHNTRRQPPPLPLDQHDNPLSLQKACKPASSLLSLKHPKLVFIFVSKPLRTSSFLKITAAAAANLTCCNFQSRIFFIYVIVLKCNIYLILCFLFVISLSIVFENRNNFKIWYFIKTFYNCIILLDFFALIAQNLPNLVGDDAEN
jgi:hypothetical protein